MLKTKKTVHVGNVLKFIPNFARETTRAGTRYNVYPCVMLVEGVHNGVGAGPVYYSQDVLKESASLWNNVPVTVGHPVVNGDHVMCNHDGTILQAWQVGHVTNAVFEDGKLKGELFIDIALAEQKAPGLIAFLENGGELEISTGLEASEDGEAGTWNTENFYSSIVQIAPDHLALLPGDTGACSWGDGCGVRFNANNTFDAKSKISNIIDVTTLASPGGSPKKHSPVFNELSLTDKLGNINRFVDSLDVHHREGETSYSIINYVRAVYDAFFVYNEVTEKEGSRTEQLYKQQYSVDTQGNIVVNGDPQPVTETVEYLVSADENNAHNNKGDKMSKKENGEGTCCPEKVKALIANTGNSFTGDDQAWLESMDELQLDKITVNAEPEKVLPETPVANSVSEQVVDFLKDAPGPVVAFINEGMKTLDQKRADLIGKIVNHDGSKFTQAQLVEMDTATIENIASMVNTKTEETAAPANFGLTFPANVITNAGDDEEAYVPATLGDSLGKKA